MLNSMLFEITYLERKLNNCFRNENYNLFKLKICFILQHLLVYDCFTIANV